MVKKRRWLLAAAVLPLILAACTSTAGRPGPGTGTTGTAAGSGSAGPGGLRAVRHVWVIELENQGYAQSFGTPSADPYLATTLPRTGALLENYYAIGHSSAANYIAQVSGQAPDIATQIDCPLWTPFPGQVIAGPYRQVLGEGCVYPAAVPLGSQLSAAGRSWAAYLQDMGNDPGRDRTVATARGPACGHPATWAVDHTQKAEKGDQYAARHDGFTFFASVTASQAFCAAHILSFRPLPGDLARAAATPAFSFIAPDLCNDGHDAPCVTGAPGGLAQADAFLSQWVPTMPNLNSAVYHASFYPCTADNACRGPEPWGVSWITAMFLHGGWDHILGNMLFLAIFGKNVEDAFGPLLYLGFYFAGGFAAMMLQTAMTLLFGTAAEARVPELGASGAIAAVLGAYFLLYPGSRIRTWIFPVFLVRIPAWVFLGAWFLYQLIEASFGLFSASANGGGVAFFAHVGGFVFGLVVTWLLARAGQVAPQELERSIA